MVGVYCVSSPIYAALTEIVKGLLLGLSRVMCRHSLPHLILIFSCLEGVIGITIGGGRLNNPVASLLLVFRSASFSSAVDFFFLFL